MTPQAAAQERAPTATTQQAQNPKPDTPAAIDFLRRWSPEGPWVLTSIVPDGNTTTETFTPDKWQRAAAWITERQGKENIYFAVNPLRTAKRRKASKKDVACVRALYVDIDPAGQDEEERPRILKLLTKDRPKGIPAPSVIIFSGGGYQAFWPLKPSDKLTIDGDLAKAEDLERFNIQLEKEFGADRCHNVDRIMRLPGTINVPNAKKRKKGRVPTLARLVEFNDIRYSIDQFTPAPKRPNGTPTANKAGPSCLPLGEGKPMGTAELQAWAEEHGKHINDSTLARIATGQDPLDPDKYPSRSEVLFAVCCELIRAQIDDQIIFRVITDPGNPISESVREQRDWQGYALRQIERAAQQIAKEPPVLHPKTPMKSAREFVARERCDLLHYNGDWLAYEAAAYAELEEGTMRREVYLFLERAKMPLTKKQKEAGLSFGDDFHPDSSSVNHILDALRAVAHRPRDSFKPPCWLEGDGPPAAELVACRNGLLYLPTGDLLEHTPRFFTRNALTFDYRPDASTPEEWLAFLKSLWPPAAEEKPDEIALLQEIFGYVLIPDTSQQKIFLMVGPTRSGKGTIARVLTELVGPPNICAPSLADFGETFGLESALGKQLAILSDVRLDRNAKHAAIAEALLRVSGEDAVTVKRKYKSAWDGRLAVRFLLLSNVMPRFSDASPALANRFVPLLMDQSFLGKEDHDLLNKLLPELPGILNWAIEGWRRLRKRGRFNLPQSSKDAIQQLIELAAPVATFLREKCVLDPDAEVSKAELFDWWKDWCYHNGSLPGALNSFSAQLYAATSAKVRSKKSRNGEARVMVFAGLRLKEPTDKTEESEQMTLPDEKDDSPPPDPEGSPPF